MGNCNITDAWREEVDWNCVRAAKAWLACLAKPG